MTSDIDQYDNLFDNTDYTSINKKLFANVERKQWFDSNGMNYNVGYVWFNGNDLKEQLVLYPEAELWAPVTISSPNFTGPLQGTKYGLAGDGTTSQGGMDVIRFKNSVLSLFGDIRIEQNNETVLKESLTHLINNVKMPIEHTFGYYDSGDSEDLCFTYDDTNNLIFPYSITYNAATNTPAVGGNAVGVYNALVAPDNCGVALNGNKSLLKGADQFFSIFKYTPFVVANNTGGTYNGNVRIKLKYLSSLIRNCNFPLCANFKLYLYFNFVNGSSAYLNMPPIQCLTASTTAVGQQNNTLQAIPANTVTISIGSNVAGAGAGTMIYYKSVKLNKSEAREVASMYEHNKIKRMSFTIAEVFNTIIANTLTTNQIQLINPDIKRVTRLYFLGYPTGTLNSMATSGPTYNPVSNMNLSQFNIKMNGTPYFINDLLIDSDFYDELMDTCTYYGISDTVNTMFKYSIWKNNNRLYAFDLSRVAIRGNPEAETDLWISFTNPNAGANGGTDYIVLTERVINVKLEYSKYGVKFLLS